MTAPAARPAAGLPAPRLAAALAAVPDGLRPVRSWPDGDALAVEARHRGGPAGGAPVAVRVRADATRVEVLAGWDPRLPALAHLPRSGGELLSHRWGRRAVVRTADGDYAKALRPSRVAGAAARHAAFAAALLPGGVPVRVPRLVAVDERAGVLRTAALPGTSLDALAVAGREQEALALVRALGAALRAMAAARPGAVLPVHDGADEARVLRERVAATAAWVPLPPALVRRAEAVAAALASCDGPLGLAHRDLHDQQVLDGAVPGLVDLDTACLAHPALDVANLAVHLQLRAVEGSCPEPLARALTTALVEAADQPPSAALRAYEDAARIRTACVHAVRPGRGAVAADLLDAPSWTA